MSDTTASLRRKIVTAQDLQGVVRTMKAVAASSIDQYEKAVLALAEYDRAVELGLGACFRENGLRALASRPEMRSDADSVGAIIFGSDQGLVGRFNEVITDFAMTQLAALPGKAKCWAVGERVRALLVDSGASVIGTFPLPNSVDAIAPLIGRIQLKSETRRSKGDYTQLYAFHNHPKAAALYEPTSQRLLPLDAQWQQNVAKTRWPTPRVPEVLHGSDSALGALIREYLFISLFRACAGSLASENASRLAAMQRADKNIDDLLETLNGTFHRRRQSAIDDELFDVIAGVEALNGRGN